MKYEVVAEKTYRKQRKKIQKRGYDLSLLNHVVQMLAEGNPLPAKYQDHPLLGDQKGRRDCHITPDWVLIYKIEKINCFSISAKPGHIPI